VPPVGVLASTAVRFWVTEQPEPASAPGAVSEPAPSGGSRSHPRLWCVNCTLGWPSLFSPITPSGSRLGVQLTMADYTRASVFWRSRS
jgi:hypothetical protein